MANRKKKAHLLQQLVAAPWWLSAVIGAGGWLILYLLIPALIDSSPYIYLDPFATLARWASWFCAAIFGICTALSLARTLKAAKNAKQPPIDVSEEPSFKRIRKSTPQQIVIDQDMHTVLALGGNQPDVDPDWNLDSLCALEWKRFELLCAKYYEMLDFKTETVAAGPDGGIDIKLFRQDMSAPIAIVQCKAWKSQVPVSEIRELIGIMTHEKVARGIFITTGSYTRDALMFGAANPVQLLDGPAFLKKIIELPPLMRDALKAFAFAGDYWTPTCASCGIKLVRRESRRSAFWGCTNYPRCRMTLKIRTPA